MYLTCTRKMANLYCTFCQ